MNNTFDKSLWLENKFLVLKKADIEAALDDREKFLLRQLVVQVAMYRGSLHKKENSYVVINLDEPYADQVLALMEQVERLGQPGEGGAR